MAKSGLFLPADAIKLIAIGACVASANDGFGDEMNDLNRRYQMLHARLAPRTEWRGGRVTAVDVLTLEDAAAQASQHAGQAVTTGDFLRAAGRGEILLHAVVHRTARVVGTDGGACLNEGRPDENIVPAGSIVRLPLTACQHLANIGSADWRTFDGFETVDGQLMRYTRGALAEGEADFNTEPVDCRVMGLDVHALADTFCGPPVLPESKEQRQARFYQTCIDAGLKMPNDTYGHLPRGVGALAKRAGISRQAFSEDVKAHIGRMNGK